MIQLLSRQVWHRECWLAIDAPIQINKVLQLGMDDLDMYDRHFTGVDKTLDRMDSRTNLDGWCLAPLLVKKTF